MPRLLIVVVLLGVLASACQPVSNSDPTTTGSGTPATAGVSLPENDRVVVSTIRGAIAVYGVTGEEISRIDPPDGHVYRQPTWLDGETVVFSDVSDIGDHALVAADAEDSHVVWRAPMETPPFYFSPAPSGGTYATTSLRNDPSGSGLIAEFVDHSGAVTTLSQESPFYTSWSPAGDALAVHIAGQHLDVYRDGEIDLLLSETGLFQTPVWVEKGLVTLRTVSDIQRLAIWDGGLFTDVALVAGPVGFVASGDLVAIQATERPDAGSIAAALRTQAIPTIPGGKLVVVDLVSAEIQTVSSDLALVYQWNLSGTSLLYATLADSRGSLVWNVWTKGQSVENETFSFQPGWFSNLVPFFDQYAQSVQFWSSSGEYLGYPAVAGTDPVVIIESLGGGEWVVIPDATWSSWAPSR
jgi:hypothetical protein